MDGIWYNDSIQGMRESQTIRVRYSDMQHARKEV